MSENGFLLCWYGSSRGVQLTTRSRWPPINLSAAADIQPTVRQRDWISLRRSVNWWGEKAKNTNIASTRGSSAPWEKRYCVTCEKKKKVSIPFTLHMFIVAQLCSQQQGLSVLRQKPLIIVGQRQIGGVRKAKPIFQLSLIHIFTVQQKFISCGWDANYN